MSRAFALLVTMAFLSACGSSIPSGLAPLAEADLGPRDVAGCALVQGTDTIPLNLCECTFPAGFAAATDTGR